MTTNKPEPIAWGIDPRKMSEADLLPCPACGNQAGKATKRAAKGLPFVGLWKVSCQRPECPLAMIYFHPVEWNQLPRIKQSDYDALQAECEKLRTAMIEAKSYIDHYMYGGSSYRGPAAKAIALIDAALAAHRKQQEGQP